MKNRIPKDYIIRITKASTYFIFRNGPIKRLYEEGKLKDSDVKEMQKYMQNHLSYLYNVLLEENDLKKFDLIVATMDKFYINDNEEIQLEDDGFNNFYNKLFNEVIETINIKK
ncbi:hypothetical protein A500_05406 [Clostridium sartagoforme AAU1]|uniref:Uncharacterized protein n=1 Tax=Clostridium sartagoforme AAU1 TaxID=1202534 RepID=R9CDF7_9CLOT|nr:hypothetical protein [Clostridium sartagoforme]EOR27298.1 hypothetical protein A500_05406 [Clostridium sartagoforme AAU1]